MSQEINLYAAHLRPSRDPLTARNVALAALVALLAVAGPGAWLSIEAKAKLAAEGESRRLLAAEQEKTNALARAASERKLSPALAGEITAAKTMLASRREIMEALDSGRAGNLGGFSPYLAGFARQAQNDWWLTGFRVSVGGEEIEIRGRLLDPARLPAYVQRLAGEPVFQGRRFAALEMRNVDPPAEKKDGAPAGAPGPTGDAGQPKVAVVDFILRSEHGAAPREAKP